MKSILSDLFSRKEQKDVKTILAESRQREQSLISTLDTLLQNIPYATNYKLSKEKIKEYKIENRLARMRKLLETPLISNLDTSALYQHIEFFANSLETALQEGNEQTAYWASMALHKSVESLWLPTPSMYARDPEMEMALYASKLQYARNFSNIIELAKRQDTQETERRTLEPDHKRRMEELQARRNMYLAMSKTEEGRKLVTSAKSKCSNPASLNEQEKAYFENQKRIEQLTGLTAISLSKLEAIDTALITLVKEIENTRIQLLDEPTVEDPRLAAKLKMASDYFRDQITRQLDEASNMMRNYEGHVAGMTALMNHHANTHKYAKIQETLDQVETEELNRQLAELEARREVVRKAQNAILIQQQTEELQRQMEDIVFTEQESEPEMDFEEEQEFEPEVEYDL